MGQPGFAYGGEISYLFWINAAVLTVGAILLPRVGTRLRGLNLTTVTDFAQARFARCNRVYKKFSAQDPPARTTISAGLPGILVEVGCVAVVRGSA